MRGHYNIVRTFFWFRPCNKVTSTARAWLHLPQCFAKACMHTQLNDRSLIPESLAHLRIGTLCRNT